MVRSVIRKIIQHWPENETFAFHGTLQGNVPSIKRRGLTHQPYICPLPSRRELQRQAKLGKFNSPCELFERAIGSALFAGSYGVRAGVFNPKAKVGELPAVLIFRGPEYWFYGAYDDRLLRELSGSRKRRSFGKVPESFIPPKNIAAVVRLTKKEQLALLSKAKENPFRKDQLLRGHLAFKTLTALQSLVEKGAKKRV